MITWAWIALLFAHSATATPSYTSFFVDVFKLATTDPITFQPLFENEKFLHAASLYSEDAMPTTTTTGRADPTFASDELQHAVQSLYNDPCIWQLLNAKDHALTRPSHLGNCLLSDEAHVKAQPQPDTTPQSTTSSPPFPPNRSRAWLASRYRRQYAQITQFPGWKSQKGVVFREYLYGTDDGDDDDDDDESEEEEAATGKHHQEKKEKPPEPHENTNYYPPLDYSLTYDPEQDAILQSLTVRQVSATPRVYVVDGFATEEEIADLVEINRNSQMKKKSDTTGISWEMPTRMHRTPFTISQRMAALVQMKNDMGGTLRTRLYHEGDSHPPHVDWFEIEMSGGTTSNLIATGKLTMVVPCVVLVHTDLLLFAPFFFSFSNVEFKNHQAWRGNRIRRRNPVSSVGQSNQGPVGAVVELQRSRERRTVFVAPRQCNQTG